MPSAPASPVRHRPFHVGPVLWVLAATLLCGWLDYATGYEVSMFALYAVPLILGTRHFGLKGGVASALLCAVVWIVADVEAGHHHAQWWVVYWNALHRLVFFLCVVVGFHHVRSALGGKARPANAFSAPVPVCTQCHRIGAQDGHWHQLDSYLCEHAGTPPSRKVCPDCARASYARAGFTERASQR